MKTLIIDNYDSFTYNLYQLVADINVTPRVIKNDEMSYENFSKIECDNIIISPGPGNPSCKKDFGLCAEVIRKNQKPILGVCLGHQGIAQVYLGNIVHAPKPMHGRVSIIEHNNHPLFSGIPQYFKAVRYHSLIIDSKSLPNCFEVIAKNEEGLIMAIAHKEKPLYGVQFHPESIASEYGSELIENFNTLTRKFQRKFRIQNKKKLTLHTKKILKQIDSACLFHRLFANEEHVAWLDSSMQGNNSRFSFMGSLGGPLSYYINYDVGNNITHIYTQKESREIQISIFDYLEQQLRSKKIHSQDLPFAFNGGFIGYFGYELKQHTLPVKTTKFSKNDAQFLFLDRFIVIDHQQPLIYVVCLDDEYLCSANEIWMKNVVNTIETIDQYHLPKIELDESTSTAIGELCSKIEDNLIISAEQYLDYISKCKKYIKDGDSYEICLTNKIKKIIPKLNLLDYYQKLRTNNPAPYSAFLRFGEYSVACSSMERFLLISQNGEVETKPIKGTLPRTENLEYDQKLAHQLVEQEKFFSENLMIVDLLRNDLGSVCELSSVHVPKMMDVESYATVHQLVSTIRGKLKQGITAIECIKKTFPGGSITGAPKIRTVEIIDQLETQPRGIYTGSIGYLSLNGSVDLNIVIRTAVKDGDELSIGIGGAIIDMSDPQEELNEILLKAKALLKCFSRIIQAKSEEIIA